jgi:hypothetical protein
MKTAIRRGEFPSKPESRVPFFDELLQGYREDKCRDDKALGAYRKAAFNEHKMLRDGSCASLISAESGVRVSARPSFEFVAGFLSQNGAFGIRRAQIGSGGTLKRDSAQS